MTAGSGSGRAWLLIPVAALIAVFPLVVHGPSYGHDFNYHLLNWMEAARQFSHGTLYPRWAYSPAYNAGEPRFVFYPPASWTLGAVIGLVLTHVPGVRAESGWTAVPIVFTWMCLAASGLAMYFAARRFAVRQAAVFGAVLYVVNPYMLFTAYERSAYAELLAATWMPLLVAELLSVEVKASRVAIPIALLWLTNAPAAVIGCYATVALALLRLLAAGLEKDGQVVRVFRTAAMPAAFGTAVGFGLSAFYLIPAAWERRFVQVAMATIVDMRIDYNFLFEHTGSSVDAVTHDEVLRTASWVAVALLLSAALSLMFCWNALRRNRVIEPDNPLPVLPLLSAVAVIAFLLTSWSNPMWQHTPELKFLQFPWRLLTVVTPVLAIAISVALSQFRGASNVVAGLVAMVGATILTCATYKPFHQVPEPEQTVRLKLQAFERNEGTDPTDEYTPQTADNDALTPGNPPYWVAAESTAPRPARSTAGPAPMHFSVLAARSEFLILNLRDYPAWHIRLNGTLQTEREQRDDGLIAFAIPAGISSIDIRYVRGYDDVLGDCVSVASVLALAALTLRNRPARI